MSEGNVKEAKILDKDIKDGFENLIAQLGTEQDKRHNSKFVNNKRLSLDGNQHELNALYRTDWLSGKVVDIIPNDMTREWRSFDGEIEPDVVKKLEEEEDRLGLRSNFNMAHKWGRLYGTAFIIMSIDDGQGPDTPLDIDKIKEGGLRHIKVVDRHRISNSDVVPIDDPMDPNFGMPEYYRFNETSVRIHHSRVLRFDGILLPFDEFRKNNYYSDSVLDRLYEAITNLNTVTNSAATMVYETNVDIFQIDGLMAYLQTAEGEALVRKRFTLMNTLKSFNNTLLLDSKETFQTKTNTFSGLPDLIDRYSQLLSAATDIPATRLLGNPATGMSATGEGDLKNYYDMIRSMQIAIYKPLLDYFDQIMAKSLGMSDDILSYAFDSLFQMTPQEQAQVDFNNAQRDQIYLTNSVINEEIVAKELKQNGTYTNITDDHIKLLEVDEDDFDTDSDDLEIEGEEKENEESEASENVEESGSEIP